MDALESDLVNRVLAHTGHQEPLYPQQRVTNLGRRVTVDLAADPHRYVFSHRDSLVAELHPPSHSGGSAGGSLLGWRLTFPAGRDRMLAAPAGDPPIGAALFFVDVALRDKG